MLQQPACFSCCKTVSSGKPVWQDSPNQSGTKAPQRKRPEKDNRIPQIERYKIKQLRKKQTAQTDTQKSMKDCPYIRWILIALEKLIIGNQHKRTDKPGILQLMKVNRNTDKKYKKRRSHKTSYSHQSMGIVGFNPKISIYSAKKPSQQPAPVINILCHPEQGCN